MAHVVASKDLCFGSGTCLSTFPTAFDLDDDDVVVVLPGESDLSDVERSVAASGCPAGALEVVDA
jgi:ferredoxin